MSAEPRELQRALESGFIVPYFQPVAEIRTGRLKGFEVLARWEHPEFGEIPPSAFIELAEQNGMIGELTSQILRKACLAAAEIPAPLEIAVNVSPSLFQDLELPAKVRSIAKETGFPLNRLCLEITEEGLMQDLENASRNANEFKRLGCRLELDDFGTGHSSLSHLHGLPFDTLKIDRSFVANMIVRRQSRKVIAATVGLARSFELRTIAEGVETEEQAGMLLWLGCEMAQGWLYGKPVQASRIREILTAFASGPPIVPSGRASVSPGLSGLPEEHLAQLQAIYDGAPVALCYLDRNLRYVSLNQAYADLYGMPVEAFIGRPAEEIIPEALRDAEPFLRRALTGETTLNRMSIRSTGGPGAKEETTLQSFQPAYDEAGEVIGVSVSVVDVTPFKAAVDEALEDRLHYEKLMENIPKVIWVTDDHGQVREVSSEWLQFTGLSPARAEKLDWLNAVHPDDVSYVARTLFHAVLRKEPVDARYRLKRRDGTWNWVHSQGNPGFGQSGELLGWYGYTEDIDEKLRLEAALRSRPQS